MTALFVCFDCDSLGGKADEKKKSRWKKSLSEINVSFVVQAQNKSWRR